MADLAKLVVKLEAQTADYQRRLEKAQNQNSKFAKNTKRNFASAKAAYVGFAAAVGSALAAVVAGLERQAELLDLSTRLGGTTEAMSRLQFAAEQTGVSVDTLNMGLQRMVRRVAEAANGTGEAKGALEELNISAAKLNDLQPSEQFNVLADALMNVQKPADRVRLAMKLFDSEGVKLIQTMQGGSAAIEGYGKQADKLGITVSQGAAEAADRATKAFGQLTGVFTGASNTLASQFAPEVEMIAAFMAEQLPRAGEFARKAFLSLQRGMVNLTLMLVETRIKWNELTRDFAEAERLRETSNILKQMVSDLGNQVAMVGTAGASMADYRIGVESTRYELEQFAIASTQVAAAIDETTVAAQKAADEIPAFWKEAQETFEVTQSALAAPQEGSNTPLDRLFGPDSLKSLFSDFQNIEERFKQLLANMLAEALAAQVSKAILGSIGGSLGGGSLLSGGLLGSLFGGARAAGGPVSPGKAYLVGENGPEMMVPNASGNIVPNHELSGSTFNMYMNVNANDADSFQRSRSQIQADMAKSMRAAGRNL